MGKKRKHKHQWVTEFNFYDKTELKEVWQRCRKCFKGQIIRTGGILICPKCGKKLVHTIDWMTKKKSKYLWYCPCNPEVILSKG